METQIHLIRHGKTDANEKRLYCGSTDLPLSDNGAREIMLLKNQGIYPVAGVFFTSGLLRTEQTLDIICGEVKRKAVFDMAEYDFGEFEMKSYEDLKEREDYQGWITDETGDFQCPGGESKNQFAKRVIGGFNAIVKEIRQIENCLAFIACHGGTIACIMEYLYPNTKNFYEWQPKPGRGYTLLLGNWESSEI
ncbi:MAG: histidine phosphatase family protein [Oscillospiraceae bacterium]|nr:histidine phosphatase family protein [Oscillospiraceae bacterium]